MEAQRFIVSSSTKLFLMLITKWKFPLESLAVQEVQGTVYDWTKSRKNKTENIFIRFSK